MDIPSEEKSNHIKDRFYVELGHVFNQFPRYNMKILLGDFNVKVGRKDSFKLTTGNESSHEISNDNGVRAVNFATPKTLLVKSTMFPHHNIHEYTWTSAEGNTRDQIDHISIDRIWCLSILDI
jgi:exonuclease III